MYKTITLLMLLLVGSASAQELHEFFVGKWQVDVDKTLASLKKASPGETVPEGVIKMMESMGVLLDQDTVTLVRGKGGQKLDSKVKSSTAFGAVLYCKAKGKDIRVQLTRVHSDRMNMKSGDTNDMDHYIWKKLE